MQFSPRSFHLHDTWILIRSGVSLSWKNNDGSGASLNPRELWLLLLSSVGLPAPDAFRVEPYPPICISGVEDISCIWLGTKRQSWNFWLSFLIKPAVTCEAWHVVGFRSWCIVFYIAFTICLHWQWCICDFQCIDFDIWWLVSFLNWWLTKRWSRCCKWRHKRRRPLQRLLSRCGKWLKRMIMIRSRSSQKLVRWFVCLMPLAVKTMSKIRKVGVIFCITSRVGCITQMDLLKLVLQMLIRTPKTFWIWMPWSLPTRLSRFNCTPSWVDCWRGNPYVSFVNRRIETCWKCIGSWFRLLLQVVEHVHCLYFKHWCSFRNSQRIELLLNRFWVWNDFVVNIRDVQGRTFQMIWLWVSWSSVFLQPYVNMCSCRSQRSIHTVISRHSFKHMRWQHQHGAQLVFTTSLVWSAVLQQVVLHLWKLMLWRGRDLAKERMAKMDISARAKEKIKGKERIRSSMVPTKAKAKAKILPKENLTLVVVAKAMDNHRSLIPIGAFTATAMDIESFSAESFWQTKQLEMWDSWRNWKYSCWWFNCWSFDRAHICRCFNNRICWQWCKRWQSKCQEDHKCHSFRSRLDSAWGIHGCFERSCCAH